MTSSFETAATARSTIPPRPSSESTRSINDHGGDHQRCEQPGRRARAGADCGACLGRSVCCRFGHDALEQRVGLALLLGRQAPRRRGSGWLARAAPSARSSDLHGVVGTRGRRELERVQGAVETLAGAVQPHGERRSRAACSSRRRGPGRAPPRPRASAPRGRAAGSSASARRTSSASADLLGADPGSHATRCRRCARAGRRAAASSGAGSRGVRRAVANSQGSGSAGSSSRRRHAARKVSDSASWASSGSARRSR